MHIKFMRLKSFFSLFSFAAGILIFIGMQQPNAEVLNQNPNENIESENIVKSGDISIEPAQIPQNAPPPSPVDDWTPEPDSEFVNNEEFLEPALKEKSKKKAVLEDFGETNAQLPFWTQEDEENQAIIQKTPHRKREIEPIKLNDLMEISRILGAMHALRIACMGEGDQTYRSRMNSLLDIEAPIDVYIRDPLILSFNSGFQSQNSGTSPCPNNKELLETSLAQKGRILSLKMANFYNDKQKLLVKNK